MFDELGILQLRLLHIFDAVRFTDQLSFYRIKSLLPQVLAASVPA